MAEVDAPSEALPVPPPAEVPVGNSKGGSEIRVDSVVYKKTYLTNALQNNVSRQNIFLQNGVFDWFGFLQVALRVPIMSLLTSVGHQRTAFRPIKVPIPSLLLPLKVSIMSHLNLCQIPPVQESLLLTRIKDSYRRSLGENCD